MLSRAYFLRTVCGWLHFSGRGHAGHVDEKGTAPSLSVFKSFPHLLLLRGSFLAAS